MLFSIGHSNKSFSNLLRRLKTHDIEILIDVRDYPHSRMFPWFSQKNLQSALEAEGIEYYFMGDVLGCVAYSDTQMDLFNERITELIILSESQDVAMMCSEGLPYPTEYTPSGCHRWWKISQYIQRHCPQRKVHHILMDNSLRTSYSNDYINHKINFYGDFVPKKS